MLRSLAVALLSTNAVLAAVKPSEFLELIRKNSNATIPGAFIVELSSSPTKRAADSHAEFLGELDKRAPGKFSTRRKYDSPLFNGIAVQFHNPEDLASLETIPNIVAVRPIRVILAPEPINRHILSSPMDRSAAVSGQSTHYMTGVDRVHEQGITGKGIKIAIIDSGVDYVHPSLGGAFGPGNKVAGGYDLVGDDYFGLDPPIPDDDPRDTCLGHGTHVAGIIAANPGNEYNISGVAYEATILAYRIFSCWGASSDEIIADAMLRAYADGADIITMSIATNNEDGIVVTVSAGNDGEFGAMLTTTPATGKSVISVASVENIAVLRPTLVTSVEHAPIPYDSTNHAESPLGQPLHVEEKPYVVHALSTDSAADDMACAPLDEDLSQYAVIIRPSSSICDLDTQLENLATAHAGLVIVYDTPPFQYYGEFPSVYLSKKEDGAFLVSEAAKSTITVTFPQMNSGIYLPNNEHGGLTSRFSSFGPSNDLLFKPALAAPGGNITSTWLVNAGSWEVASGTSMACPYVAWSAALLLQVKGKAVAKSVRSILQTTSRAVPASRDRDAPAQTLAQAGAGLIDVYNALNVNTEIYPAELLLNDTDHWNGLHKITIKNTGKKVQTYKLAHWAANTLISLGADKINYREGDDIKQTNASAGVHLSLSRVTLLPGHSATVLATISPPKDVDNELLPIVSGWITASGSQGDNVKVSYMGVAGSFRRSQVISTGNHEFVDNGGLPAVVPRVLHDGLYYRAQRGPMNYTLDCLPFFAFMLAQASRHVTLHLLDVNSNITSTVPDPLDAVPPAPGKRGLGWSWWWPGLKLEPSETLGLIADWRDQTRGPVPYMADDFPTRFANGTDIPLGQYKLLLRALRLSGDPRKASDWDVYVSQQVGLVAGSSEC